ncbi:MAG: SPOR domain-containing protein [Myxococcales bacterium]|nr:SPOR domain-containing protein [Myxococcales bacterium]
MRDLDQIREREDGRDPARTVVLAVGGLAAACVLFAAGVLIGRDNDNARAARREDPLARLDALAAQAARAPAPEVTYPSQLAERRNVLEGASGTTPSAPNTASAQGTAATTTNTANAALPNAAIPTAVGARAAIAPAAALVDNAGAVRTGPAPARLPVASSITASATPNDHGAERTSPAPAGADGAFSLQVSSFRNLAGAQTFAQRLRERGHRAFVASGAATTGTGTWHRVRIGPFNSVRDVSRYRSDFEARERLPTFVVRRDEERPRH